ncbi:EAL domain-containing protein [Gracilibacillus caseinilyticus]|uniref:EAL domain-containing protein n=1 Tax=Gracilibacillus caseinilyticus TaxID=2932256 RepID=A0ABY4EWQ5_9BACI|nr:EAL domain-containing protein [Gracilibacillus caseinilyticus]UOQ48288.1 EAL domain-containing protein [Gracilibacillus caseinilyticus]
MSVTKLHDLITNEKFEHYFQALYDLKSLSPVGYEALLRTRLFKNPEILFEKASQTHRFFELEVRSIRKALIAYDSIVTGAWDEKRLLINVYPANLAQLDFPEFLDCAIQDTKIRPNQIILEINEPDIMQQIEDVHDNVKALKNKGYSLAIDDVGKGVSSLKAIVELKPDFVKMDRYFAQHLAKSSRKQEMVRSIVNYCLHTDTKFVLEGIEVPEDLAMAKSIGVSYVQGFLLARPEPLEVIQRYEGVYHENSDMVN